MRQVAGTSSCLRVHAGQPRLLGAHARKLLRLPVQMRTNCFSVFNKKEKKKKNVIQLRNRNNFKCNTTKRQNISLTLLMMFM
jgi:hypothetical protein